MRFYGQAPNTAMLLLAVGIIAFPHVDARDRSKADSGTARTGQLEQAEQASDLIQRMVDPSYEDGSIEDAIALWTQALALTEKEVGPNHPETATGLNILAQLYQKFGRYEAALPLFKRTLGIVELRSGRNHPDVAECLSNLAGLHAAMGNFDEALPLFERALAVQKERFGLEHPSTAITLSRLGSLYLSQDRFEQALAYCERAAAILEQELGRDDPNTATSFNNLACLFVEMGRYEDALPIHKRALAIFEAKLGHDHPETATSLHNLASLYDRMGLINEALPLYILVLDIREKKLGPDHPHTCFSRSNLAGLYHNMGNYTEAISLCQRALESRVRLLGPNHPETGESLGHLASLYLDTGRHAEAEPLFERAIEIGQEAVGPEHLAIAGSLAGLAALYEATERHPKAIKFGKESVRIEMNSLRRILNYFPEADCLAYTATRSPSDLPGYLGSGPLAASVQLQTKGLVMESMGFRRRLQVLLAGDSEGLTLLRQREQLAPGYQKLLLEQGESAEATLAFKEEIDDLDKQINLRLRGSSGASLRLAPPAVELTGLQEALPKSVLLLEAFRYSHLLKDSKGFESRFAWTVIGPASSGEPLFIPLGAAELIDAAIAEFRHWARPVDPRNKQDPRVALRPSELNGKIQAASQRLYDLLWLPLVNAEALPREVTAVVISADSQLHFLPFGLLSADGERFLCQDYTIRYVNSGRDLVNAPTAVIAGTKKALLVGNPLYGDNVPQRALAGESIPTTTLDMNLRTGMAEDTRGLSFAPLPGTSTEIALLKSLLEKAGYDTGTLDGRAATETNVQHNVQSPAILHFATHGFFLPEPEQHTSRLGGLDGFGMTGESRGFGLARVQNPMYRSGLALAGAETTRKMWEKGDKNQIPPTESDGILLAAEAATLDLRGTELVVLSACSTAEGKALDGEGVMGLRRALAVAGARNVVMSLWAVEDEATVEFMKRFYGKYLAGTQPAIALHETTRELLLEGIPKYGLQGAISRYGAFIATSMGGLKDP